MKKILASTMLGLMFIGLATSANAHGARGFYHGSQGAYGAWRGNWVPFAVGAVAGVAVANAYYRPAPLYYTSPYAYPLQPQMAAFCPENGLYYPQTQACPSGWQRVNY